MGKPEGVIENYLIKQAKKHNFLCYKFVSPSNNGVPDRIIIGNGLTLFIELKAPGEVARKQQQAVINRMRKHGATVYIIDSKQQIDELFASLINQTTPPQQKGVPYVK